MQNIKDYISNELKEIYSPSEIRVLINMILEKELNLSPADILTGKFTKLSDVSLRNIKEITNRLTKHEPIQYILGETEFYNLKFKVNNSVLIPRPETEELVEWIVETTNNSELNILDIGTGSGAIAVSVATKLPKAHVYAWEVSKEALIVAGENAQLHGVNIVFEENDILKKQDNKTVFDIIISNPPYIAEKDRIYMGENILGYEPHLALFAPDENPLLFYDKISDFASESLSENGVLFFEINSLSGDEIIEMLKSKGFEDVELRNDISGHPRMIKAVKSV